MSIEQALNDFLGLFFGFMIVIFIFFFAIIVFSYVCNWKIFEKAGIAGWKCLIPFYNSYLMFQITWGDGLYFLLLFVPLVNYIIMIITFLKLSQAFGQEDIFTVGLILLAPIFLGILAFNKDIEYLGPIEGNKKRKQNYSETEREWDYSEKN